MDELDTLVDELSRLRPAEPSAALRERIARELAVPSRRRMPTWWMLGLALPAAAVIAGLFVIRADRWSHLTPDAVAHSSPATAATPNIFKPIAAENVLYAATDEGVVTLADGETARRERLNYVDTIVWENPQTHASLTWSLPREEVRLVPVRYQ